MVEEKEMERLKLTVEKIKPWLRAVGIIMIVGGVFAILSIVGILWAWILIWMGITLLSAANRAEVFVYQTDATNLTEMLKKIRLYLILQIVAIIVIIGVTLVIFISGFHQHFYETNYMFE